MALVKFGQQTLNIDGVPEGMMIISESDVTRLRATNNAYDLLKSRLPVNVSEEEYGDLIEKGKRYAALSEKLDKTSDELKNTKTELGKFSNLPKDFSVEQWNKDRQRDADAVFASKIDKLTAGVYEKIKKELGVDIQVDPRFIPADTLETFDPDAADAADKWYQILDNAHTEQEKFLQSHGGNLPPTPAVGQPGQTPEGATPPPVGLRIPGATQFNPGDRVSDGGVRVGKL